MVLERLGRSRDHSCDVGDDALPVPEENRPGHDLMAGLLGVHQIPDVTREFLLECLAAFPE